MIKSKYNRLYILNLTELSTIVQRHKSILKKIYEKYGQCTILLNTHISVDHIPRNI